MHSRHPPAPSNGRPVSAAPPYTIREYRPGDEVEILKTFNRVFGGVDPNFVPRTMEEWEWAYKHNPSGWRIYLAVHDDGRVLSQYAGIPERARIDGEPTFFTQAVDSMTDPSFRAGLKRPGLFVLTSRPYSDAYGGPPPDKDAVVWGYPIPPAWRIGKRYMQSEVVRTQLKLVCEPDQLQLPPGGRLTVEELERFPDDTHELFDAQAARSGAIAVRDKAHLDWRYVDKPGADYAKVAVRRDGRLVGLAVARPGVFSHDAGHLLADWLVGAPGRAGEPFDLEAAAELLAWWRDRAVAANAGPLTCVFPDTSAEWLALQEVGFRARDTVYFLTARNFVKQYDMRWLRRHWFYTLGNSDLV